MAWFRAGSNVAKLAVRRTLSQSCSYLMQTRISPARNQYFHTTVFRSKTQSAPVPRPVPLSRLTDSFLDGTSSVYLEELQRAWSRIPIALMNHGTIFLGTLLARPPPRLEFLAKQFKRVCG
ncbi:hypothetical protein Sango_0648900 [Sesamum angolense]|uniref:Uncharacterized protein n=1 Tax=Sesamum angolense TaxID=2727404 RepID=A0AAE1X806_9LAMI|nr:hypothetical protein Sango_0648900 [Sesamum angolense]